MTLRATRFGPLLTLLLWVLPLPAQAQPSRDVEAYAQGIVLDRKALLQAMGPPPAAGSEVASNDLAILLWLQGSRTPRDGSQHLAHPRPQPHAVQPRLGGGSATDTPRRSRPDRTAAFLAPINAVMGRFKRDFGRPGPFVQYPQIQPCLPREASASSPIRPFHLVPGHRRAVGGPDP
jgi:hypothetical protein